MNKTDQTKWYSKNVRTANENEKNRYTRFFPRAHFNCVERAVWPLTKSNIIFMYKYHRITKLQFIQTMKFIRILLLRLWQCIGYSVAFSLSLKSRM